MHLYHVLCGMLSKYGRRLAAASLGAQDEADLILLETEESEAVHSDDEDEDVHGSNRRVVSITELEVSDSDDEHND